MPMERPWVDQYPEKVPADIDPDQFASLIEFFDASCDKYQDRPAFTNMGSTITYAELASEAEKFAAYLQHIGCQRGDRVAVMMPNLIQYPIALFGILKAGLTVVNVNPLYTARELNHQLKDSGAETILIVNTSAHILQGAIANTQVKHVIVTEVGDCLPIFKGMIVNFALKKIKKMVPDWHIDGYIPFKKALKLGSKHTLHTNRLGADDIAFLQYTGGTTGVSKGAVLTHRNILANIEQTAAWFKAQDDGKTPTVITALPLYHIFALTVNCLTFIKAGGHNVLITNPRDMAAFVDTLETTTFNVITGVNTLFNGLLNQPAFRALDFSNLKLTIGGGMAVQQSVADDWQQLTGQPIQQGYGLSETSPCVSMSPLTLERFNGTIGIPLPSTYVSLRSEDGQPVPIGQPGELSVKGPQVMKGYWQRPEETQKTFTSDGWLLTGDIATFDEEGYLRIVDRKKDMILVSGFNVFPNEIEDVVCTHTGVLEAACIGVPETTCGEAVKVYVVKKDDGLTQDALKQHCKEKLTGYKVPRYIEFIDSLPKSNVGKVLRRELKQREAA